MPDPRERDGAPGVGGPRGSTESGGSGSTLTIVDAAGHLILVVCDDASLRELLVSACRHERYQVVEASSASQMAAEMSQHAVDVVLAAEPLPRDGTFDLVAAVQKRSERGSTPVLLLATDEVVQPIVPNDPLSLRLTKPVHWRQVSEAIGELIGGTGEEILSETG